MKINLELEPVEVQAILRALAAAPYSAVFELIPKIQQQAQAQVDAQMQAAQPKEIGQ